MRRVSHEMGLIAPARVVRLIADRWLVIHRFGRRLVMPCLGPIPCGLSAGRDLRHKWVFGRIEFLAFVRASFHNVRDVGIMSIPGRPGQHLPSVMAYRITDL
jgi:hypothetical protein